MYIFQKTIQRTVNGEQVDCMSLNMIADPTCNQVDSVEPDFTMWREPGYTSDGTTVSSKAYIHIKGDEDVSGNPLYVSGDVSFDDGDDVNGVHVWVSPYEEETSGGVTTVTPEKLHILFDQKLNIEQSSGHIVFYLNPTGSKPTILVGSKTIEGDVV